MKRVVSAALLCLFTSVNAFEFDIGVSGGRGGVDGFYFSLGEHYNVPEREIVLVERSISRDDTNVAYFLAAKARRDVRYITELRLSGKSWWDISLRLGLDPRTIYVIDTYNDYGPPYGKAYGYYKDKHYRLDDRQVVELVNVRFLSEYYRISPDEVIERRRKGVSYHNEGEHREIRHRVDRNKEDGFIKEREREEYRKREERFEKERERDREEYKNRRDKHKTNRYENETRGNGNGRGRDW